MLINRINEVVQSVSATYRTTTELEVLSNVPGLVCDEVLMTDFADYVSELDDQLKVVNRFHTMGSEDFAFISQKVPSAFFGLGVEVSDTTKRFGLHNPG